MTGFLNIAEPSVGFEPTTYCLQGSCSTSWAKMAIVLIYIILVREASLAWGK